MDHMKFEFVVDRDVSANAGAGQTTHVYRFTDDNGCPLFIIMASKEDAVDHFEPELLTQFLDSVSKVIHKFHRVEDKWRGPNEEEQLEQCHYEDCGYQITASHVSSKNIKNLIKEASGLELQ